MTATFRARRRQSFLSEGYSKQLSKSLLGWNSELRSNLGRFELGAENIALEAAQLADNTFQLLVLSYTAGEPMERLRQDLTSVIEAYERYQAALAAYEQVPTISPLGLDQLGDYARAMQIMGLCILLHRPDLLRRVAALIDPGYKGEDTLYEDLLAFYETGRIELDEWYHEEPYSRLIHALYEEDKATASAMLDDYCQHWYKPFRHLPWHDSHLRINGDEGDYFGYWAFEAGAVAYLLDLDDSKIQHMVYPKDLVAWARLNKHLEHEVPTSNDQLERCPGGEACPRTGFWHTPAQANSRRFFQAGEVMPRFESAYGGTIWQWDIDQGPPKL